MEIVELRNPLSERLRPAPRCGSTQGHPEERPGGRSVTKRGRARKRATSCALGWRSWCSCWRAWASGGSSSSHL
eukprot:1946305-Alexandrium_andersonii.AAC.1